mgnify:CR=1 FL=1
MGSFPVAKQTAEVLRDILSSSKWASPKHALHLVRSVGSVLIDASPVELGIGNIVRRVLYFIREAYFQMKAQQSKRRSGGAGGSGAGGSGSSGGAAGVAEPALVLAPTLSDLLNPKTEGVDYSEPFSME